MKATGFAVCIIFMLLVGVASAQETTAAPNATTISRTDLLDSRDTSCKNFATNLEDVLCPNDSISLCSLSRIASGIYKADYCPQGSKCCPDNKSCCLNSEKCCIQDDNTYDCCEHEDGKCCEDKETCCPEGYTCAYSYLFWPVCAC